MLVLGTLLIAATTVGASASIAKAAAFPYEQMVMAKIAQCNGPAEADAYLARHSTRYMLREAGVDDETIHEARSILWKELSKEDIQQMTSVVPSAIAADPMFLDERAALAAAAFPISEAVLIEKAKAFLYCAFRP